ncbi:membrane protein [Bacteroidia bacterium]|nr:membrane protein [Bacteroidia bacterium]GHT85736.1 membrane protein [Bacteroidia bacterium]
MKKYIYSLALLLLCGSCSDFLDTLPHDALSPGTTWQTEDDAEKFLTGCYNSWIWGEGFFFLDCASDIGYNFHEEGSGYQPTGNGSLTAGAAVNFYSFTRIRRVLTFLENIENVPFANEAKKKDMIAQARIIRAYDYFKMNFWYGGVPIITLFKDGDEAKVPRNSEEEVKKYVYDEIDAAIADINDAPKSRGHVAKGTALALKMRSALYWGDYQRALDAATAIKALNQYELESDFAHVFTLAGRDSKEIILAVQHEKNLSDEWIVTVPNNGDGGWSSIVPTQNLVDLYEMSNGLPKEDPASGYDATHPFNNRDPRMAMTVLYPGQNWASSYNGILNTLEPTLPNGSKNPNYPASAANASKTGLTWAKYVAPIDQYDGDFYSTSTCYIVFRYAEVLLTIAEAKNELTGPSDQVYDALDEVRTRAGMPAVDKAKYATKDALRELIRRERSVELAGEGHRRADIVRWKDSAGKMVAETVLNKPLTRITGTINYSETNPGLRTVVDPTKTEQIEPRKFVKENRYLPFRQSDRDKNPLLDQNNGY